MSRWLEAVAIALCMMVIVLGLVGTLIWLCLLWPPLYLWVMGTLLFLVLVLAVKEELDDRRHK